MHTFQQKYQEGCAFERLIDAHFSKSFIIHCVNRDMERLGIDRIFINRKNGHRFSVDDEIP